MALSSHDLGILSDTVFFPARFRIAKTLDVLLADLKDQLAREVEPWTIPVAQVDAARGKIFRGENYRQFPYQLLDFPRRFDSRGVFAYRSLCRWGHEWSFTLHLQGEGLEPFRKALASARESLTGQEVWWCVNDTPWDYHFEADNYQPLDQISAEAFHARVVGGEFVKLSRRWPLARTEEAVGFGLETFRLFRKVLS